MSHEEHYCFDKMLHILYFCLSEDTMLIQSEETGHDLLSGPFPLHCQSSVDNALKLLW